jgi:uncharacterized membrane protein (DUF373 family)
VPEKKERPRGMNGTIWALEHAQDYVSLVVGVLLIILAAVVLVTGIVEFFREISNGPVETAAINLLDKVLLVLILVEIVHTVVLSLRAHHLVAQPLITVGLVATIRRILFVLSNEATVPTTELAVLIAMTFVFVVALIVVARYDRADADA